MSVLDEHGLGARIDRALRMARHVVEELEAISVELAPTQTHTECPSCAGSGYGGKVVSDQGPAVGVNCAGCHGSGRVGVE